MVLAIAFPFPELSKIIELAKKAGAFVTLGIAEKAAQAARSTIQPSLSNRQGQLKCNANDLRRRLGSVGILAAICHLTSIRRRLGTLRS